MKKLLFALLLLLLASYAGAQTTPPVWIDTGAEIKLRNSGSRPVITNTNFRVTVDGSLETSSPTAISVLPYGSGLGQTGVLRFFDLANTNYVGFRSPDILSASQTFIWPTTGPIGVQCISNDGTGQLGWSNCAGGTGSPGGSNTQVQFNNAGSFAGSSGFVFNNTTSTLTVTNAAFGAITLSNPLTTAYGGSGLSFATQNGVLYGNGTGAFGVTSAGSADTVLSSAGAAPSFSGQPTLGTGIITKGQDAVEIQPFNTGAGQTGEIRFKELLANGSNYVGFKAADTIGANVIWKLPAIDSTGSQCLASNGNGILGWSACSASASPGGANTYVQYNGSGSFSGDAGFIYNVGSQTATIGNLALTNPLLPPNGGTGVQTLAVNGVLFGNGTSAIQVTAQGAANTVLIANAGAPSFSNNPTLGVGLITKGQSALRLDPYGVSAGNTGEIRFLELASNGTNYVGFKSRDSLAANVIWNLPIADSSGVQCLASDGALNLGWSNCGLSIGGSNQFVQFNNSGILGGDAGFVYDAATDTATLGNLVLTNALTVPNGGTARLTFTTNGVIYGNGVSGLLVTAQGGANTVLTANNGAPAFSGNPTLATGITTGGQAAVSIGPYGTSTGNTGEIRFLELAANGSNYVGFRAGDSIGSNILWTLPAVDSSGTQCLASNGSTVLSWSACSAGTGTPGGSTTQIQYNNAGSFAASPKMTFDGTTTLFDTLQADGNTFKVASATHDVVFGVPGSRAALLKLSGLTSGTISLTTPSVAGAWTLTLPNSAGAANQVLQTDGTGVTSWTDGLTTTNAVTVTNKRVTPRVVSMADATTITPTSDTADKNIQSNTQSSGTLNVNAPSGTPTDGQCLWLRIISNNPQLFNFNAVYRASGDLSLPTSTTGSGKSDYLLVCYHLPALKWDLLAKNMGF